MNGVINDIAIYGAGNCGKYIYEQIINDQHRNLTVKAFIDNSVKECLFEEVPVFCEDEFAKIGLKIDAVIIAIVDYRTAQDIAVSLHGRGYRNIYIVNSQTLSSRLPILNNEGFIETELTRCYSSMRPHF